MNKVLLSLFVIILFGSFTDASVIILYEDNFDGDGAVSLHGLAPDIDNYGGANTWIAYEDWKADGTPAPLSSATLPFTPMPGKIYRLTARFENVMGNNDWLALGFTVGYSSEQGSNDDRFISGDTAGQPWMLRRGDQATGNDQTFTGPGTLNSQDISNTLDRSLDVDFQIILDTRPTQWQSTWHQKLTSESEYYTVRNFIYSINPSIEAVGLACANEDTTGDITYFLLEEIEAVLYIVPGGQPMDAKVFEGETAIFQVAFVCNDSPTVTWYRSSATGDIPVDTEDPNITVTLDYYPQAEEYTSQLQIQNAGSQDEGTYYCVISNDDYISVQSDNAKLAVKRLVAHWSLDEADYNDYYLDTVAGYIAQPTGEPNFIPGVRYEPNGAVAITLSNGWGASEAFPAELSDGFSICLWLNWNGDWQLPVSLDDLVMESGESGYTLENTIRADQRWQHICITYEDGTVQVYLNSRLIFTETWELPVGYEAAIEIGNTQSQQILNGDLDDIRLYNYALSQTEISQLVTGHENCTEPYGLEYDFSGPYGVPDCVVDLYDLAEFSENWLENNALPCTSEYDFSGPSGIPDCVVNLYDLAQFLNQWLSCGIYPSCF